MRGRYVIFADDDADDLELITSSFKLFNREVTVLEFKDGKEVMKFLDDFAVNASAPLLIILDMNMPRMNGRETLQAIREHPAFRTVPVVIYTTSVSDSDREFCTRYSASWISKPFAIDDVKLIARVISDFCNVHSS